ncbi:MAG: cell division protein FtsL [Flavobacteriaceae bacterium]
MIQRLSIIAAIVLFVSALATVTIQHRSRNVFIEIERTQSVSNQLELEYKQLQLDQSVLASHARIESMAKTKLGLSFPAKDRMQYLPLEKIQ